MKKAGILNSEISRVLSYMGHTDRICIGDCGLPIPDCTERIDLALTFGEPAFIRTLRVVTEDMKAEKIVLAEEIKTASFNAVLIIVNPADSDAVTGAVEVAIAKGVKVISVDRAVNDVEIDCQIASDNVPGAELATQYIVDTLGEGIRVAEL